MRAWARRTVVTSALALLAAAVIRELTTPAEQRTGTGQVLGVPYDLRVPTPARVRRSFWDPDSPRLLTPRTAGVGWGVNVARLLGRTPATPP